MIEKLENLLVQVIVIVVITIMATIVGFGMLVSMQDADTTQWPPPPSTYMRDM